MTHFLLKTFIKNYGDTKDNTVRKRCGFLSSIVGIICNILLFIVKFIIGSISASVAIISDAFNNLSDCLSCIVTLIAYNLAEKPADKEHPFGYGRIEYFSSLLIGCLIIIVGWEFLKTSWSKIFHYQQVQVSVYTLIALIFSIFLKLWLFVFNKKLAAIYNNSAMAATAYDSLSDSITTSVTLVGTIISMFTSFPIDGIIGILVSLLIIKTAVSIIKDTIDTLLGKPADKETVQEVLDIVLSYPEVLGVHDLIIHNYGPNHMLASLHAEIDSKMNIMVAHEAIDKIENELNDKLHIMTTIHLDPIETDNEQLNRYKEIVKKVLKEIDPSLSFHDFRMVNGKNNINLIFDILLTDNYNRCKAQLKTQIDQKLQEIDPRLHTIITFDNQF